MYVFELSDLESEIETFRRLAFSAVLHWPVLVSMFGLPKQHLVSSEADHVSHSAEFLAEELEYFQCYGYIS